MLERRGLPSWVALGYGGWGGLGLALLHDTAEPLAYLCVAPRCRRRRIGDVGRSVARRFSAPCSRARPPSCSSPRTCSCEEGRSEPGRWAPAVAVFGAWGTWLLTVALAGAGAAAPEVLPHLPLAGYRSTRPLDLPATLVYLVIPALIVSILSLIGLRRRPTDAALWGGRYSMRCSCSGCRPGRQSCSGTAAGSERAWWPRPCWRPRLRLSTPRLWRVLAVLFASSASWTAVVAARYLLWDVRAWLTRGDDGPGLTGTGRGIIEWTDPSSKETSVMAEAVIVSTARTGIGKAYRGALNNTHGATVAAHVIAHAVQRAGLEPAEVEDTILGCALPEGATGQNIARQAALRAGLPVTTGGVTVNRFCSSGLQAIAMAAHRVIVDHVPIMVAGGVESISCRAERAHEPASHAGELARGAQARDLHDDDRKRPRWWRAATTSRARCRTSTPWPASNERQPPSRPAVSRARSCPSPP